MSNRLLDFRLPPNITVTRQPLPNGIAYVFRDVELGELGRLAVEGTLTGETRLTSEVAGFPSDPMTQRRLDVLDPLCKDLMRILESIRGKGDAASLPVRHPQPVGQVLCEEVRCDACGKMVAFLVFAEGATDAGRFEDCARLMYTHYTRNNVPTYIIGPALGDGPMECRPANILTVWPQRGPMECLRPEDFNPRIIDLADTTLPLSVGTWLWGPGHNGTDLSTEPLADHDPAAVIPGNLNLRFIPVQV